MGVDVSTTKKVTRKLVRTETYREHRLEVRHLGPDLLCYVDGEDLNSFYINANAAIAGGQRYVDAKLKAQEKR